VRSSGPQVGNNINGPYFSTNAKLRGDFSTLVAEEVVEQEGGHKSK
jgi:hypothetical protein